MKRAAIGKGPGSSSDARRCGKAPRALSVGLNDHREIAGRMPGLDALRGVAISLVLLVHFTTVFVPRTWIDRVALGIAMSGWIGVDVFFVLSGFLITGILLDARGSAHFFRNFYIRRSLRIAPLYYGFLLSLLFLVPRFWPAFRLTGGYESVRSYQGWYWSFLLNWGRAFHGYAVVSPPYVGHFWTLAVEEQFYLVWPVVVFFLPSRHLARLCLALVVCCLGLRCVMIHEGITPLHIYENTFARLDALAVGGWVAITMRAPARAPLVRTLAPWIFSICASSLLFLAVHWGHLSPYPVIAQTFGYSSLAIGGGALVVLSLDGASTRSAFRRSLSQGAAFLGRYSYGMYVLHPPLLYVLKSAGIDAPLFITRTGSALAGSILFVMVGSIITLGVSLVSWFLVEQPALSLRRFFPRDIVSE